MNKKLLTGIIIVAVAAVFYIVGALVGWPMKNNDIAGDIGKAKKSKTQVVNIDKNALQEKMLKDTAFRNEVLGSIKMTQLETQNFEAMLQISQMIVKDDSGFQSVLEQMKNMDPIIHNINLAINQFSKDMECLSKGQMVEDFEQNFNNAVLSYSLLDRAMLVANNFNDVLNEKKTVDQKLALLGSLWNSAKKQHNVINNLQSEDNEQVQFAELNADQFAQLTQQLAQYCEEELQKSFVNYAVVNYTLYHTAVLQNEEFKTNTEFNNACEKLANAQSLKNFDRDKINFVVYNFEKLNASSIEQQNLAVFYDLPLLGAYWRYIM